MRLTADRILELGLEDEATGKLWLSQLKLACDRKGQPPVFAMKGPALLNVRRRVNASGFGTARFGATKGSHDFQGGEQLRVTSVICERNRMDDTLDVSITLVPQGMKEAAAFAGMSMPLDQAMELLDGVEEWAMHSLNITKATPRPVAKTKVPTLKAARESSEWGAW